MNADQVQRIRSSHALLAPLAMRVGEAFYRNLFAMQPQLRGLFATQRALQAGKLMDMIQNLVDALDSPERRLALCHELGQRHSAYGVDESHYDAVGVALLRTLREALGEAFSEPVEDAWGTLYGEMAEAMMAAPDLPLSTAATD